MPTYLLLGATGSTGSAILRRLVAQPPRDLTLNILVRSKSKLLKAFPDVEKNAALRTNITEATLDNATALSESLRGVDVVFGCIGSNESRPGISLIYDTSTAIINALKVHKEKQGSSFKPPLIIQLRSASLNAKFKAAMPVVGRNMAAFCFHHVYLDLDRGCKLYVSAADSEHLLRYIFVDPPSIHDPDGTTPTGYKLILDPPQSQTLSYSDLGAAFCELAERKDEFANGAVAVSATGEVKETWGILKNYMVTGMKGRIFG